MKRQSCCSTHGPVVEQDEPGVQDLGIDQAETGPWVAGTNQLPCQPANGQRRAQGQRSGGPPLGQPRQGPPRVVLVAALASLAVQLASDGLGQHGHSGSDSRVREVAVPEDQRGVVRIGTGPEAVEVGHEQAAPRGGPGDHTGVGSLG